MPTQVIYAPLMRHSGFSRHTRGRMGGSGIVSPLLDGGLGAGSSYSSIDDYIATTGRNPGRVASGTGLGKSFTDKLGGLSAVKPETKSRKPKNINFSL
jgi:hypothetical protein